MVVAGGAARRAVRQDDVRARLVRILQDAHAGELAAAYAYRGHWKSLESPIGLRRGRPDEAAEIRRIEGAEWHHRALVAGLLAELSARPRRRREVLMAAIGRFFGALCFVGGWFAPMYAAGRLEAMNVGQYEDARVAALDLGLLDAVAALEAMRVEEDRHERWFGNQIRGHRLLPVAALLWKWRPPEPTVSS